MADSAENKAQFEQYVQRQNYELENGFKVADKVVEVLTKYCQGLGWLVTRAYEAEERTQQLFTKLNEPVQLAIVAGITKATELETQIQLGAQKLLENIHGMTTVAIKEVAIATIEYGVVDKFFEVKKAIVDLKEKAIAIEMGRLDIEQAKAAEEIKNQAAKMKNREAEIAVELLEAQTRAKEATNRTMALELEKQQEPRKVKEVEANLLREQRYVQEAAKSRA